MPVGSLDLLLVHLNDTSSHLTATLYRIHLTDSLRRQVLVDRRLRGSFKGGRLRVATKCSIKCNSYAIQLLYLGSLRRLAQPTLRQRQIPLNRLIRRVECQRLGKDPFRFHIFAPHTKQQPQVIENLRRVWIQRHCLPQ